MDVSYRPVATQTVALISKGGCISSIAMKPKPTDKTEPEKNIFERLESEVRAYCRSFPTVFVKAKGSKLWDAEGREYIDFFAGAGALNYGHNHPQMKEKLIEYLTDDGIVHGLDMSTEAKGTFLRRFNEVILQPRGMDYKVMFPGPTGTNAVESALKLARKVTGRETVISFTNAFHGMTLGALAVTGNLAKRASAGAALYGAVQMPFDGYLGDGIDTSLYLERFLEGNGSGVELPAAIILETLQGEGGLNTASIDWLRRIEELCNRWDILLIVDDIQAGVGRTGTYFSFEPAGIKPDIICLSKSLSGYGLPMSINLIKPQYDAWSPGEHNGTFRGNNAAFVTATESLSFWENNAFERSINEKAAKVRSFLTRIVERYPQIKGTVRGRGLMQGIACDVNKAATQIARTAFKRGLLMETAGPNDEVLKLMPPLTIGEDELETGLQLIEASVAEVAPTLSKNPAA